MFCFLLFGLAIVLHLAFIVDCSSPCIVVFFFLPCIAFHVILLLLAFCLVFLLFVPHFALMLFNACLTLLLFDVRLALLFLVAHYKKKCKKNISNKILKYWRFNL